MTQTVEEFIRSCLPLLGLGFEKDAKLSREEMARLLGIVSAMTARQLWFDYLVEYSTPIDLWMWRVVFIRQAREMYGVCGE